jgi:hypothetical protein
MPQRIDQRAVVGSVTGCLHYYISLETQAVPQGKELLPGGVAWRVLSRRRIGEYIARSEYMAVRIDASGRQPEARRGRVRMEGKPSRCHLEIHWQSLSLNLDGVRHGLFCHGIDSWDILAMHQ